MTGFTNTLKTEWIVIGGRLRWRAIESFEFHSGARGTGLFIRCDAGMLSDLASIPWLVRWLIPQAGVDAQGAFLHDRGYRDGFMMMRMGEHERRVPVSRAMVDAMYYQAMKALGTPAWRREAIYRGLQIGGWVAWNRLRKIGGMKTETTA